MVDISKLSISKNTPIPLYYQLKQCLLSQIYQCSPGDVLPSENEIVNALGISRPTVRQAFNELVNEGYIHRDKGRGTFVSKPKVEEGFFQKLESFNNEMLEKGLIPSTQVLDCDVINGRANINKHLNIAPDEQLVYLCRLRYANNEPLVYFETYLPYDRFAGLEKEDFEHNSLYSLLEHKYYCKIIRAVRNIEASSATAVEAKYLSIKPVTPIIFVRTLAYDEIGFPVEYSVARYRGDRNTFTVELRR